MNEPTLGNSLVALFFAPDEGLPYRMAAAVLTAVVVIRALYLALPPSITSPSDQLMPGARREQAEPEPIAPRRWWPTREDRLVRAVSLVRAETDLILSKTDAANASLQFARARAELAAVLRQLQPSAPSEPTRTAGSPLSLAEMEELLSLIDLDDRQRAVLDELIEARIQERSS